MVARTNSRQVIYSNHEFENSGLWSVTVTPCFVRRKRFKFMTLIARFAICAAGPLRWGRLSQLDGRSMLFSESALGSV